MSYLLLGVLGAFVLYLALRWFVSSPPAQLAVVAKTLAIAIAAIVGLLLIVTGRIGVLYMLGALVLPLALAWYRRRKVAAGGFGDPGGLARDKSEVQTAWLRMELDTENGRIDGHVRQGGFAGRRLADLADGELLRLYQECAGDAETARLLEAYLDRRMGPGWQRQEQAPPSRSAMSREEALQILGVAADARPEDIKAAHRRLMAQLHPDKGGSTYLAAKVNQARDLLLGD